MEDQEKEMTKKPYYITAPIYYPSANLHLGNTYTSIICSAVKNYKTEEGYEAYYVTGSDEHGEKLAKVSAEHGQKPVDYIAPIVSSMQELWKMMDVEPDVFVRSSSPQHERDVRDIFNRLYEKGDIYKGEYQGYYCTSCEAFWTRSQLAEGQTCPDCGRPVQYREEESYFFRLSHYQDKLLAYYKSHPNFLKPLNREKEMVGSFFKEGLQDLSVSRRNLSWGVPVPFDPDHVIYVWIDALVCYLTGIGYGDDPEKFARYWPAQVHFIGRDIVRFHAIIWPAILMALDLPLPEQVFAHGWILFDADKMSKSKGNVIYPEPLVELYGRDAVKYFVLREFNFGSDGNFSSRNFLQRLNSDLANDLGNLVQRSISMVEQYRQGVTPAPGTAGREDQTLMEVQKKALGKVRYYLDEDDWNFQQAFESIWELIRAANKYVDLTTPWILNKEGQDDRLDTVLYRLMDALRSIAILLRPFMPDTSHKMLKELGLSRADWNEADQLDLFPTRQVVHNEGPLFPRLDIEKELQRLHDSNNALIAKRKGISLEELERLQEENRKNRLVNPAVEKAKKAEGQAKTEEEKPQKKAMASMDDFDRLELRVGRVIDCRLHPDADRLLVETVDFGDEVRTVVSGIRQWYQPEDMVGKQFVFVTNLPPRKIRGIESQGMILTAEVEEEGLLSLLSPEGDIPDGAHLA